MNDIKPIETRYKGYRFRSRLEARWAVFFDALGVKWEYEPEGFELASGWYLPDFRLPQVSPAGTDTVYIEIKPAHPSDREMALAEQLAESTGCDVFMFVGSPGFDDNRPSYQVIAYLHGLGRHWDGVSCEDDWYPWSACNDCGCAGIVYMGCHLACRGCSNNHSGITLYDSRPALLAYQAARAARFEHGETP